MKKNDKILIAGSGITGLCAGAILSKLGYKTTILESHPELIGGHSRTYNIEGLNFSAGPQYLWNFGTKNGDAIGDRVLRFLEIDRDIKFESLNPDSFEKIFLGNEDQVLDVPMGLDRFQKKMIHLFPEEEQNLTEFFNYISAHFQCANETTNKGLYIKSKLNLLMGMLFSKKISFRDKCLYLKSTTFKLEEMFEELNITEKARRYLYGHAGLFAENASDLAFSIYAAATGFYHNGAVFPVEGIKSIVDGLETVIKKNGGTIELGKKVVEFTVKKNHLTSAICEDKSEYPCDRVISNLSPRLTYNLIPGCDSEKLTNYSPSNPAIIAFIGLSDYPHIKKLHKNNLWWQTYPGHTDFLNIDMNESPRALLATSATANCSNYKNTSLHALNVFAPGNYHQAKEIFDSGNAAYKKMKQNISEKLLEQLEKQLLPDVRKHVTVIKILTPMETHQETLSEQGNIYGRRLMIRSLRTKFYKKSHIKNLHIACATIGMPGVAIGFQTAVSTVEEITGTQI